jgi:thiamine kinase-like enzyme
MNAPAELLSALSQRGFHVVPESFRIGRPDRVTLPATTDAGAAIVAKKLPADRAELLFRNMNAVWRSSFGERREPPGLPRPLDYIAELNVVIMERLTGRPLAECGDPQRHFDNAIRLIAELHSSDAQATQRRSARSVVRSARRKTDAIIARFAEHAALAGQVIERLEAVRPKDAELVPSHGDYSPRNVIFADRLALIDWERFQMADPARDVAYFATWDWPEQLKRGRSVSNKLLKRATDLYEQHRPGSALHKRIPFHAAAGLTRRAASLVELWPEQSYLVPALLRTALRQLE